MSLASGIGGKPPVSTTKIAAREKPNSRLSIPLGLVFHPHLFMSRLSSGLSSRSAMVESFFRVAVEALVRGAETHSDNPAYQMMEQGEFVVMQTDKIQEFFRALAEQTDFEAKEVLVEYTHLGVAKGVYSGFPEAGYLVKINPQSHFVQKFQQVKRLKAGLANPDLTLDELKKLAFDFFSGKNLAPLNLVEPAFIRYWQLGGKRKDIPSWQVYSLDYVWDIAEELGSLDVQGPILEVCAGEGYLAGHLRSLGLDIIATDASPSPTSRNVVPMDVTQALNEFKPGRVIASWLPGQITVPDRELTEYQAELLGWPFERAYQLALKGKAQSPNRSYFALDLQILHHPSVKYFLGVYLVEEVPEGIATGTKRIWDYPHKEYKWPSILCQNHSLDESGRSIERDRGPGNRVALFHRSKPEGKVHFVRIGTQSTLPGRKHG